MPWTRRQFGQTLGVSALAAGCFPAGSTGREKGVRPMFKEISRAVYLEGLPKGSAAEDVIRAAQRVAQAATDFSWLGKGDTVLLKPAGNSKNPYPATTSPLAVIALTRLLKEKGAGRVILADKSGVAAVHRTPDHVRGSTRACFIANGLHQAALDAGAEVLYFEEEPFDAYFADTPPAGSHWKEGIWIPSIVQQADHIVLLPRVSRHVLAGSTLGLKMAVGWLRDDSRLELHRDAASFYEKVAEMHYLPALQGRLRLTLSVATKALASFGPDSGTVAEPETGLVFASESLLAHDFMSLSFLLWCREHAVSKGALGPLRDPHRTFPGAMNRVFVGGIWGMTEMLHGQTFAPTAIRTVWDDPVLARAMAIEQITPLLEPQVLEPTVPPRLQDELSSHFRRPAA